MRRKTGIVIEGILASFPDEPPDAVSVRVRVHRYVNECGCSAGGIFLVLAAVAVLVALTVTDSWRLPVLLLSMFAIATASIVGKMTGIAIASLRLHRLRRGLQRRILSLGITDVHVH
jgi:hypothetical protein